MIWELLHRSFFGNNPSRNSKDWRGLSYSISESSFGWVVVGITEFEWETKPKDAVGTTKCTKTMEAFTGSLSLKTISTSVHTFSSKKQEMVKGKGERTFSDWIKDEELLHIIWLTLKDVGWICTRSYKRTIINAFDFIEFPD